MPSAGDRLVWWVLQVQIAEISISVLIPRSPSVLQPLVSPVPLQHFLGASPGLLQRQLLGAWVLVGGTAGSVSALTSRESPV